MNKVRDYRALEREYISTNISLRELCRRHGISSHSVVVDQAKKGRWAEKREAYRARESESFIEAHAERMADRQAQISDKVIDTIGQVLDKFRADLKATKLVRQPDGTITEVPAWYMTPKDLCLLIDRFEVLFEKPSVISQHHGLTLTSELCADALREFLERTRGLGGPPRMEESPLPRIRRLICTVVVAGAATITFTVAGIVSFALESSPSEQWPPGLPGDALWSIWPTVRRQVLPSSAAVATSLVRRRPATGADVGLAAPTGADP